LIKSYRFTISSLHLPLIRIKIEKKLPGFRVLILDKA
jgi:hypothetical protein